VEEEGEKVAGFPVLEVTKKPAPSFPPPLMPSASEEVLTKAIEAFQGPVNRILSQMSELISRTDDMSSRVNAVSSHLQHLSSRLDKVEHGVHSLIEESGLSKQKQIEQLEQVVARQNAEIKQLQEEKANKKQEETVEDSEFLEFV